MKLPYLTLLFFLFLNHKAFRNFKPVDEGSKVHFTIKNFGIKTNGSFKKIDGEIFFDPKVIDKSVFNVTVQASTIDTDNSVRDKSLREDYFETVKYPLIRMVSTKIEKTNKTDDGFYYFTGNLIIKGVSRPVSFPFKVENMGNDLVFSGEFNINRLDFGVGSKSTVLGNLVNVSLRVTAKTK